MNVKTVQKCTQCAERLVVRMEGGTVHLSEETKVSRMFGFVSGQVISLNQLPRDVIPCVGPYPEAALRVQQYRKSRGMGEREFDALCGFPQGTVAKLEIPCPFA